MTSFTRNSRASSIARATSAYRSAATCSGSPPFSTRTNGRRSSSPSRGRHAASPAAFRGALEQRSKLGDRAGAGLRLLGRRREQRIVGARQDGRLEQVGRLAGPFADVRAQAARALEDEEIRRGADADRGSLARDEPVGAGRDPRDRHASAHELGLRLERVEHVGADRARA